MLKPVRFSCSQKICLKWDPPVPQEDQQPPTKALKAIQSCIKDEHFWYFRDEVMSNV